MNKFGYNKFYDFKIKHKALSFVIGKEQNGLYYSMLTSSNFLSQPKSPFSYMILQLRQCILSIIRLIFTTLSKLDLKIEVQGVMTQQNETIQEDKTTKTETTHENLASIEATIQNNSTDADSDCCVTQISYIGDYSIFIMSTATIAHTKEQHFTPTYFPYFLTSLP